MSKPNTVTSNEWVSIESVMAMTSLSLSTVRRRIADGTLEAKRFGPRLIRVRLSSLEAWGENLGAWSGE